MSPREILELTIIAFIVCGIVVAIWKGGARNPVGTGGLDKRLDLMSVKVNEIEGRVEMIEEQGATKGDIERLEKSLEEHTAEMKLVRDVVAKLPSRVEANHVAITKVSHAIPDLESRQRAMADRMADLKSDGAARSEAISGVSKQIDRLYDVLVTRGIEK